MNENMELLENKIAYMSEEGFVKRKSFFGSYYIYQATQAKMKKHYVYMNAEGKHKFQSLVQSKNFNKISEISKEMNASCRLEVWIATDKSACVMQLQEYIPHNYHACSEVVVLKNDDAQPVINFVK